MFGRRKSNKEAERHSRRKSAGDEKTLKRLAVESNDLTVKKQTESGKWRASSRSEEIPIKLDVKRERSVRPSIFGRPRARLQPKRSVTSLRSAPGDWPQKSSTGVAGNSKQSRSSRSRKAEVDTLSLLSVGAKSDGPSSLRRRSSRHSSKSTKTL